MGLWVLVFSFNAGVNSLLLNTQRFVLKDLSFTAPVGAGATGRL